MLRNKKTSCNRRLHNSRPLKVAEKVDMDIKDREKLVDMQACDITFDRFRNQEDPLEIKGKERNNTEIKSREFQQGERGGKMGE